MLSSLIVALQVSAAQPVPDPAPPQPSIVLAEVVRPARFIGFPRMCVEPDDNGEVPICMMEIYEADVRVLRHWDGPIVGRSIRVRFTAHSFHAVWRRGVRFILALVPFEDRGERGNFASYWDWEDDAGRFCKDVDTIRRMDLASLQRIYEAGPLQTISRDTDSWSEGSIIRCVTGREQAAH